MKHNPYDYYGLAMKRYINLMVTYFVYSPLTKSHTKIEKDGEDMTFWEFLARFIGYGVLIGGAILAIVFFIKFMRENARDGKRRREMMSPYVSSSSHVKHQEEPRIMLSSDQVERIQAEREEAYRKKCRDKGEDGYCWICGRSNGSSDPWHRKPCSECRKCINATIENETIAIPEEIKRYEYKEMFVGAQLRISDRLRCGDITESEAQRQINQAKQDVLLRNNNEIQSNRAASEQCRQKEQTYNDNMNILQHLN